MTANGQLIDHPSRSETVPVRPASTVIILRDGARTPRILMGRRSDKAAFMPSKFVFPGGCIEDGDQEIRLAGQPQPTCLERLSKHAEPGLTKQLLLGAIREVWEETGLRFACPVTPFSPICPPRHWRSFADHAQAPCATGFTFIYRAVTPPGISRRFDARFFLADLTRASLLGDADDFSSASDELSDLHWAKLSQVSTLDLPSITRRVLKELTAILSGGGRPCAVPFYHTRDGKFRTDFID